MPNRSPKLMMSNYLKIFPKKGDPSRTWYNPNHDFEDTGLSDGLVIPTNEGKVLGGKIKSDGLGLTGREGDFFKPTQATHAGGNTSESISGEQ